MREFKFRIWHRGSKRFLSQSDGSLHCTSHWMIDPFTGKIVDYVDCGYEGHVPSPEKGWWMDGGEIVKGSPYVIQQYTGEKDKTGKEIYEGDIVNCGSITNVVDFAQGSFWVSELSGLAEIKYLDGQMKVLGNIFENPELLK